MTDVDSDYAGSRVAIALRLLIFVVVTGLVVAFVAAGVFTVVAYQLTTATH